MGSVRDSGNFEVLKGALTCAWPGNILVGNSPA
jgi:hypothetical protein